MFQKRIERGTKSELSKPSGGRKQNNYAVENKTTHVTGVGHHGYATERNRSRSFANENINIFFLLNYFKTSESFDFELWTKRKRHVKYAALVNPPTKKKPREIPSSFAKVTAVRISYEIAIAPWSRLAKRLFTFSRKHLSRPATMTPDYTGRHEVGVLSSLGASRPNLWRTWRAVAPTPSFSHAL